MAAFRRLQAPAGVAVVTGSVTLTLTNPPVGGSLMIAYLAGGGVWTPPTGWTKHAFDDVNSDAAICSKLVARGDSTAYVFSRSGTQNSCGFIEEWAGFDKGMAVDIATSTTTAAGSTNVSLTPISPMVTSEELLTLCLAASGDAGTVSFNQGVPTDNISFVSGNTRSLSTGALILARFQDLTPITATWTTPRDAGFVAVSFTTPDDQFTKIRPQRITSFGPFITIPPPIDVITPDVQVADSDSFTFADSFGEQIAATLADSLESFTWIELAEQIAATLADTLDAYSFTENNSIAATLGGESDSGTGSDDGSNIALQDAVETFTFIDSFTEALSVVLADTLESFGFLELGNTIAATLSDTLDSYGLSELGNSIAANLADAIELLALGELQENLAALLADTTENFTWIELQEAISAVLSDTLEPFTFIELAEDVQQGLVQIADSDFSPAFSDGFNESIAATVADTLETTTASELQEAIAATVGGGLDTGTGSDVDGGIGLLSSDSGTANDVESTIAAVLADSESGILAEFNAITATLADTLDLYAFLELAPRIDIPLPPGNNGTATIVFADLYSATVSCGAIWSATVACTQRYSATVVCTTHTATLNQTDLGEATQIIV